MSEEQIWFEGTIIKEICQKCEKNRANIIFEGMPRTNPNILVFCCWHCYEKLDKNMFKIATQGEAKLK